MSSVGSSPGTRAANGAAAISAAATAAGSADARFHSQLLQQDRVHTLYTTCCSMGGCNRAWALAAAFALHALDMWTTGSVPEFLVGLDDLDWQFGPAFAYSVRIVLPCSGYDLKLGIFTSNNLASVLYICLVASVR